MTNTPLHSLDSFAQNNLCQSNAQVRLWEVKQKVWRYSIVHQKFAHVVMLNYWNFFFRFHVIRHFYYWKNGWNELDKLHITITISRLTWFILMITYHVVRIWFRKQLLQPTGLNNPQQHFSFENSVGFVFCLYWRISSVWKREKTSS